MTTDYDPIVEQYKRSKLAPWRTYIESFTLFGTIGDVRDQQVLDVACGEGYYSRLLRLQGAAKVIGVDLSAGMVARAQQQEAEQPLGIEYVVGDGKNLPFEAEFDLVVAAYLLNYAATREELAAMCDSIAHCIKPGGRFVTVNCNPGLDFPSAPSYRQYGFETSVEGDWREGAPIIWTFFLDDGPFSIENYYLSVPTHEALMEQAGFQSVHWRGAEVSPQAEPGPADEFWQPFLQAPPVTVIACVK